MSDDDLPDRMFDLGVCEGTTHHVLELKHGDKPRVRHVTRVEDGEPLPQNCDLFHVDPHTGKVVSRTRIGQGPAQVATPAYKTGWEAIFGKPKPKPKEPN